jgi:hypothetical protein
MPGHGIDCTGCQPQSNCTNVGQRGTTVLMEELERFRWGERQSCPQQHSEKVLVGDLLGRIDGHILRVHLSSLVTWTVLALSEAKGAIAHRLRHRT